MNSTFITSYEKDEETNLDFAQARYFNSGFGRFSSPDSFANDTSVSDPQSWNLYAYVRNNPLRYNDPSGKELWITINNVGYLVALCEGNYKLTNPDNPKMGQFAEGSFEKSVESLLNSSKAGLTTLVNTETRNSIDVSEVAAGDEFSSSGGYGADSGYGDNNYKNNVDDFGMTQVDDTAGGEGIMPVPKTAVVFTNSDIGVSGDNEKSKAALISAVDESNSRLGKEVIDGQIKDNQLFPLQSGRGLGTDPNCPTSPEPKQTTPDLKQPPQPGANQKTPEKSGSNKNSGGRRPR